jgi:tetratricopeptide (TPR) repeat protein
MAENSLPEELVVLAVKERAATCIYQNIIEKITVQMNCRDLIEIYPGEIIKVKPLKKWTFKRHQYMTAELVEHGFDLPALKLTPLILKSEGEWDPKEEYWGEPGAEIDECFKPIIQTGKRPCYEMEQVLQDMDPEDDLEDDEILKAAEAKEAGDLKKANKILMDLLIRDLRCLDAHAHLGNLKFDYDPEKALVHYRTGVQIGELSLPENFNDVLLWGHIDNRPFLRCLHGYGLCLWRLNHFAEAMKVFTRMLWMNPPDNQGIRFLIEDVRKFKAWRPETEIA